MPRYTENLEALRLENRQIASRITRICLILIGGLIIVTFTITNALERVDIAELQSKRDAATAVREAISTMRREFDESKATEKALTPDDQKRQDELTKSLLKSYDEERDSRQKYDALLKESFSVKPNLFGSGLSIDLRSWIYGIPFVFLLTILYLRILRKKQSNISIFGKHLLSTASAAPAFDHLVFSANENGMASYERHPSQLEHATYFLITLCMLSLAISSLSDASVVPLGLSLTEAVQYCLMFLTALAYAVMYYSCVAFSLDRQLAVLIGESQRSTLVTSAWNVFVSRSRSVLSRFKPRVSLTTGSLLIIASLFLSTSASCDMAGDVVGLPGHELLRQPSAAWWISSKLQPKGELYWENAVHGLGRFAYILGVAAAISTLLLVSASIVRRRALERKTILVTLFVLSMIPSLMIVADFAFNTFWFKDELFLVSNVFWIAPTLLLSRMMIFDRHEDDRISSILTIILLPLCLDAIVYAVFAAVRGFFGATLYFVGINLISLTYLSVLLFRQPTAKTQMDCGSGS